MNRSVTRKAQWREPIAPLETLMVFRRKAAYQPGSQRVQGRHAVAGRGRCADGDADRRLAKYAGPDAHQANTIRDQLVAFRATLIAER